MPQLFPPWSNTALRMALATVVIMLVGIPAALCIYVRSPYVTSEQFEVVQPVMFDHRHHVADDGIDCRYCHSTVETSPYDGVPPTATCMGCHAQIWNASALLEPVRRAWFTGQPIVWKRVHQLPDFVYFNHSIHVSRGIECATCHGRVEEMAQVRQMRPLTMGWCLGCHRDPSPYVRVASRQLTSCTTCHR